MSGRAGERRQLVVTARDAVEGLGEVGRPLQDDLLHKEGGGETEQEGSQGIDGGSEEERKKTVISDDGV